jgi:hypothetical protein
MSHPAPEPSSRWSGMGEALRRMAIGAVSAAVGVGLLGAGIAWAARRSVSTGVSSAYYIVGCGLFLMGMFPTGGFSTFRGRMTRRRPTGSRQEPIFLLGILLVGLGVIADVARPF